MPQLTDPTSSMVQLVFSSVTAGSYWNKPLTLIGIFPALQPQDSTYHLGKSETCAAVHWESVSKFWVH
jgi:F0F1-type ATP synthase beta subunit